MKLYDIKKEVLLIVLILATLAVGLYFYPQLPDQVPTHWGVDGQVNGWSSKTFAVFFFPGLILFLYILLSVLPAMDPLKVNIELFSRYYFWLKLVFVIFMASLYLVTILAGLGYEINVGRLVSWGVAILFLFMGLMMPKIKKNYTIGIRFPWTLHSEVVWEKTHRLGGWLFGGLAVLMLAVGFWPGIYTFWALVVGVILMLVILMGYSYWEYRKLGK